MSASDIERHALKTAFVYVLAAAFCALFGFVYEQFSHGVYSDFMVYAFSVPLAGGAAVFLAMGLFGKGRYPGPLVRNLWHSAVATATVGSILSGVLEIYGTGSRLLTYYPIAAGVLAVLAVASWLLKKRKS